MQAIDPAGDSDLAVAELVVGLAPRFVLFNEYVGRVQPALSCIARCRRDFPMCATPPRTHTLMRCPCQLVCVCGCCQRAGGWVGGWAWGCQRGVSAVLLLAAWSWVPTALGCYAPPERKVRAPAHTKHLGWYLEFEFRHGPRFQKLVSELEALAAVGQPSAGPA